MSRLKFLLRCAASFALIALVLRKVNLGELAAVLSRLDFYVAVPASALTLLLISLLAVRWRLFLRQQGVEIAFNTIFSLTWAGQFFNSILPGSTGGDFVKIYQLCRLAPTRKSAAAASVVVDRFSALVVLAAWAGIALIIDPVPMKGIASVATVLKSYLWLLAILAVGGMVTAWILYRYIRATHWLVRVQHILMALKSSLVINKKLLAAIVISSGIHSLSFFIVFLFARSLGINITFYQIILILPVVLMCLMVPITVNGHGLREVLLIFYFNHHHITMNGGGPIGMRETVVALSVVCVANDLLWNLPGGLWYLLRFKPAQSLPNH